MRYLLIMTLTLVAALPAQPQVQVIGADGLSASKLDAVRRLTNDALDHLAPSLPTVSPPFTVVVHPDLASLPAPVRTSLHAGAAGVALLGRREIHLILERAGIEPPNDLRTVVRHEVVHILLHDLAGAYVPRWFHEGLAQLLTGATYLGVSEEDIAFHASTDNLLRFSRLRTGFPRRESALRTAYAQSFSFVSFLERQVGLTVLLQCAAQCRADTTFADAFLKTTGTPLVVMEEEWVHYVKTGSGAAWRVLLTSCFGLLIVASLPLLAMAGVRRWNRDLQSRHKLEREDLEEGGVTDGAER